MLDITKHDLIISHFHRVQHSHMSKKYIEHKEGRPWDGFIYILKGSCRMIFSDGSSFTTKPHALVYLAKDSLYNMDILEAPYEVIYADFLFDSPEPRKSLICFPDDPAKLERRFLWMKRHDSLKHAGYVSECLALLYRFYAQIQAMEEAQYLPSPLLQKIEAAKNTILEQYASDALSVASLAEAAGMSEVYFRKLFRGKYGISPVQFIAQVRLNEAKTQLCDTELSLKEIARACGFSSLAYFCRTFKEQTEQTPSEYRKSNFMIF